MSTPFIPELEIKNSRRKSLIMIAIFAVVVGTIYAFLLNNYLNPGDAYKRHSAKELFVIYACGPIYVIMLFYGIYRAFKPKASIKITKDFVWWSVPFGNGKDYTIPWSQVTKLEAKNGWLGGNVRVFVQNPEYYYSEKSAERKGQEVFAKKHGTHIMISAELIEESAEELRAILQNYHDVVSGKPGAKIIPRFS
jgi:hypothetical protein